jgi:conjugal transfer pilus assembly protein TraV
LNPSPSDFNCPDTDPGKCDSVRTAYEESKGIVPPAAAAGSGDGRDLYREALYSRFAGLLREPETPMVVPPRVMRVLLLPYRGAEGELYMLRYAYLFVEEPRWILGDQTRLAGEEN